jgi:hypothetical protein
MNRVGFGTENVLSSTAKLGRSGFNPPRCNQGVASEQEIYSWPITPLPR